MQPQAIYARRLKEEFLHWLNGKVEQMSEHPQPDPLEATVRSVPLDLDDGPDRVIEQENLGPGAREGGGEWPSPLTPPRGPAPGTVHAPNEQGHA